MATADRVVAASLPADLPQAAEHVICASAGLATVSTDVWLMAQCLTRNVVRYGKRARTDTTVVAKIVRGWERASVLVYQAACRITKLMTPRKLR